jgi:hypothetical protein
MNNQFKNKIKSKIELFLLKLIAALKLKRIVLAYRAKRQFVDSVSYERVITALNINANFKGNNLYE